MTPAVLQQLLRGHARQSIMALSAGGGAFIRPESTPRVGHNRDLAAQEGRQRLVADLPDAAVADTAAMFDTVDTTAIESDAINNPGIRYPPRVPKVELPMTYSGCPVFIPSIAGT